MVVLQWFGWTLQDLILRKWLFDYNVLIVGGILISVLLFIGLVLGERRRFSFRRNWKLELRWIILPTLVSFLLILPTLQTLYLEEGEQERGVALKRTAHQWYWSYSYSPFEKEFDSFLKRGRRIRLLERDNIVVLPFNVPVKVSTTSEDVLHCWTLPSLGLKIDSNPGRLNTTVLYSFYPGKLFGQCREICGANHSFIPIEVEFTRIRLFTRWLIRR